jgi:hypothetical protein
LAGFITRKSKGRKKGKVLNNGGTATREGQRRTYVKENWRGRKGGIGGRMRKKSVFFSYCRTLRREWSVMYL